MALYAGSHPVDEAHLALLDESHAVRKPQISSSIESLAGTGRRSSLNAKQRWISRKFRNPTDKVSSVSQKHTLKSRILAFTKVQRPTLTLKTSNIGSVTGEIGSGTRKIGSVIKNIGSGTTNIGPVTTSVGPVTTNIGSAGSERCLIKDLPSEILDNFVYRLDDLSKACLSMTCRGFNKYLRSAREDLNQCGRWRLTCYVENDLMYNDNPVPNRLACAYCKTTKPSNFFEGDGTGMYLSMIECPDPSRRFCRLHIDSRISSDHGTLAMQHTREGFEDTAKREWELTMASVCGHCGCAIRKNSFSTTGCQCAVAGVDCNVCQYYPSLHFWRLGQLDSRVDAVAFGSRQFHLVTGRAPFPEQHLYVDDYTRLGGGINPLRTHRSSTNNPLKFNLPPGLAASMKEQIDAVIQKPWKIQTSILSKGLFFLHHRGKPQRANIAEACQRINFLACCYKTTENKDEGLHSDNWIEADVYPKRAKKLQDGR